MATYEELGVSEEDALWIEQFYIDFEKGQLSLGKEYTRPVDYIERALKVIYGNRKVMKRQQEGLTGYFRED